MAINQFVDRSSVGAAEAQLARVGGQGSAGHPHLAALIEGSGPYSARDTADAVHLLCSVHGRYPGLVEQALGLCPKGPTQQWLGHAADAFERERLLLVRLTASVGPLPSTPGAAETETALVGQRHALEVLARSERRGCALGAATALVCDWWSIREFLDRAADRVGIESPSLSLPDQQSVMAVIQAECDGPASERALAFGGEQLLLQNRGLFDLLEARAAARERWDG